MFKKVILLRVWAIEISGGSTYATIVSGDEVEQFLIECTLELGNFFFFF